jgi:hypothetical protein
MMRHVALFTYYVAWVVKTMDEITCLLPGGYVDDAGRVHRRVTLAPLCGKEEEFVAGKPADAALVTALLSRCMRRLGTISPVSEDVARNLLVADRQYLLLKLRALTFGDRVQATIVCPWTICGAKIDCDFSITDIPVEASAQKGPIYRMELSPPAALAVAPGEVYQEITFRLPNGADQEVIAPIVADQESRALTMLLRRCIQSIGPLQDPGDALISALSPLACTEIESQMEAVAPKVELTMGGICLECGHEFDQPFAFQTFFFNELRIRRDLLYREVHYLAYHYHWSEREIMEMPRHKRRKYIAVLAEEIERLTHAAR